MTREQIMDRIRAELRQEPDATCVVVPAWTASILQTDQIDGIPVIYDDPADYADGTIH